MLRTLNPFTALHRGLKVLITASIFRARFVKNFVAIKNSAVLCYLVTLTLPPSLSFNDILLQCLVRDSIPNQTITPSGRKTKLPQKIPRLRVPLTPNKTLPTTQKHRPLTTNHENHCLKLIQVTLGTHCPI